MCVYVCLQVSDIILGVCVYTGFSYEICPRVPGVYWQ